MAVERVANLHPVITVWKVEEAAGIATVAEANEVVVATTVVAAAVEVLLAMASTRGRDRPVLADTAETTIPAAAATSTGGEIKKEKNRRKIARVPAPRRTSTTTPKYNCHSLFVQCPPEGFFDSLFLMKNIRKFFVTSAETKKQKSSYLKEEIQI